MSYIAYCDFIAYQIKEALEQVQANSTSDIKLHSLSNVKWDLDQDGALRSPTKTITIQDHNNSLYKITIEKL